MADDVNNEHQRAMDHQREREAAWHTLPATPAVGGEADGWQWRACIGGRWGSWLNLEISVENFRKAQSFNLDNGTYELRPLYAAPPASPLRGRELALQHALESCRTSYCGYAITDQDQYRELLGKFWKEIKRIDGVARAALASSPEQPAATDTVTMYSDALVAANVRIAELEDKLWKAAFPTPSREN